MKRINSFWLFMVALLLALGAGWLANNWIFNLESQSKSQSQNNVKMVPVVVASLKIPYGQTVNENAVKIQSIPESLMSDDYFTSIEEVNDLVTNGDIFPDEILNRQRVTDKMLGAVLASLINIDMRAVTVRVNDVIGVAGFLLPNNRVDVLSYSKKRSVVDTVLQNIKVLAVDQTAQQANTESNAVVVRAVTLEVTPEQAETLYKAIREGSIQLALRNPEDGYVIPPPPEPVVVKVKTPEPKSVPKLEPKPEPKPEPIPEPQIIVAPTSYSVTVIRGLASSKKKFKH